MVQLGLDTVLSGTPSAVSKTKVHFANPLPMLLCPLRCQVTFAACKSTIDGQDRRDDAIVQVVCTLGPKSRSVEMLEELLRAGMAVARFNFSHGSHDYHQVLSCFVIHMSLELGAQPLQLCRKPWTT